MPSFGDWFTGIHASYDNPHRHGMYVRTIRRTGRMNRGTHYELTDGYGSFYEYPVASVVPRSDPPVAEVATADAVPVPGAVGACVLNGCQNAEWSRVAHEALAERDRLRTQKRTDDDREIAYVQTIGRLRDAVDAALDWMENVTQWVGPGVPEDRDDVVTQLGAALDSGEPPVAEVIPVAVLRERRGRAALNIAGAHGRDVADDHDRLLVSIVLTALLDESEHTREESTNA
jgi:hypothetical protein